MAQSIVDKLQHSLRGRHRIRHHQGAAGVLREQDRRSQRHRHDHFQNGYKSIKSIINPAFFNEAQGFLGTLDETNDIFYMYTYQSPNWLLVENSDQSSISGLKSNALLDLTGITMYVPTAVVNATIVVQ